VRIAFVAHQGSIHTRRWSSFFADRGHDVHVITCGDGDVAADGAYEVHDLGAPSPPKAGYLRRVPAARAVLRRLRPDVVHAHYATSYGLLALASGVRPLVVTAHGSDVLLGRANPIYAQVMRRVFRAASFVTVPSEEMRDAVVELTGHPVDVQVFQYGIESRRLAALAHQVRQMPPAPTAPRSIVTARPLRPLYRLDVLLDGLALLESVRSDWSCTVLGDGEERANAEAQVRSLGLDDRVTFAGQRSALEVETALAGADIYVSLAESDGASIALLEAMALGAVPVVSDITANRAWIRDGENGVLSQIDAASACESLVRALTLDRASVAALNRSLVAEHADRDRNLGALEQRMLAIVTDGGVKHP